MTLNAQEAVAALTSAGEARGADGRLTERLARVQTLLADDLAFVERALAEAAGAASSPAREAALHLVERGGKRVRPLALLLSNACFGPVSAPARELALVAELVHSATLLHDDVVDEGMERRGAVTSRRLYGNGVSVLAGDLLLVDALERTARVAPAELPGLLATLRQLVDGEIVQLRGRTELDVSRATYERVLRGKTASLFEWCAATGARVAGAGAREVAELGRFGAGLGMAFQLVDDVLDYSGEDTGKSLFADLAEGKLTLPLVLAIEKDPALCTLVARIHAGDRGPVAEVSRAVVQSGACDEVRRSAVEHTSRAVAALAELPGSSARSWLEGVAHELARRVS